MKKRRNEKTERNRKIYESRCEGAFYSEIAREHRISICRVRQIIDVEERKAAERAKVANGR